MREPFLDSIGPMCAQPSTTPCDNCADSGACPACEGVGWREHTVRIRGHPIVHRNACATCRGSGRCAACGGANHDAHII